MNGADYVSEYEPPPRPPIASLPKVASHPASKRVIDQIAIIEARLKGIEPNFRPELQTDANEAIRQQMVSLRQQKEALYASVPGLYERHGRARTNYINATMGGGKKLQPGRYDQPSLTPEQIDEWAEKSDEDIARINPALRPVTPAVGNVGFATAKSEAYKKAEREAMVETTPWGVKVGPGEQAIGPEEQVYIGGRGLIGKLQTGESEGKPPPKNAEIGAVSPATMEIRLKGESKWRPAADFTWNNRDLGSSRATLEELGEQISKRGDQEAEAKAAQQVATTTTQQTREQAAQAVKFERENTKLGDGQYVSRASFATLPDKYQTIGRDKGLVAMNNAIAVDNFFATASYQTQAKLKPYLSPVVEVPSERMTPSDQPQLAFDIGRAVNDGAVKPSELVAMGYTPQEVTRAQVLDQVGYKQYIPVYGTGATWGVSTPGEKALRATGDVLFLVSLGTAAASILSRGAAGAATTAGKTTMPTNVARAIGPGGLAHEVNVPPLSPELMPTGKVMLSGRWVDMGAGQLAWQQAGKEAMAASEGGSRAIGAEIRQTVLPKTQGYVLRGDSLVWKSGVKSGEVIQQVKLDNGALEHVLNQAPPQVIKSGERVFAFEGREGAYTATPIEAKGLTQPFRFKGGTWEVISPNERLSLPDTGGTLTKVGPAKVAGTSSKSMALSMTKGQAAQLNAITPFILSYSPKPVKTYQPILPRQKETPGEYVVRATTTFNPEIIPERERQAVAAHINAMKVTPAQAMKMIVAINTAAGVRSLTGASIRDLPAHALAPAAKTAPAIKPLVATSTAVRPIPRQKERPSEPERGPLPLKTPLRPIKLPSLERRRLKETVSAVAPEDIGALAWKQGQLQHKPVIKLLRQPYKQTNLRTTVGRIPIGVTPVTGKGSANKSITLLTGTAPRQPARVKIGFQEATITRGGPRLVNIAFKPLRADKTLRLTRDNEGHVNVKEVPSSRLKDYAGMNKEAAKTLHFNIAKGTDVELAKTQVPVNESRNLTHELVEMEAMHKGTAYWPAHLKALRLERRPLKVIKRHDDGDLTVKTPTGQKVIITPDRQVFKAIGSLNHRASNPNMPRSEKVGQMWRTKVDGGTIYSRFPLTRKRRRRQ